MSLEIKYFVLKPKSKTVNDAYAIASRAAMELYSTIIAKENPELAKSLHEWVVRETVAAMERHRA